VYVSDETAETEKPEQAEELDETEDFEGAARARQLIPLAALLHQQENVVERYRAEKVHEEPRANVVLGDLPRLQNDLVDIIVLQNTFI
jgi:hypothetical protein